MTPSDPLTRILNAAGAPRAGSSDYDLNRGISLPEGRKLRPAAVLVAVETGGDAPRVFAVPLAHVLDPARFRVEQRRWKGTWRRYYTVPYGPYYIWGATARILRVMADMAGRP